MTIILFFGIFVALWGVILTLTGAYKRDRELRDLGLMHLLFAGVTITSWLITQGVLE